MNRPLTADDQRAAARAPGIDEQRLDDCGHCTLVPSESGEARFVQVSCAVHAVGLAVGDSKPTDQDPSVSVEETPQ